MAQKLTSDHPIASESNDRNSPLWRVKYRPQQLEEIRTLYPEIYKIFLGYVNTHNIPHLLLVGPTGSSKTTLAEILGRELLKSEQDLNFKILFADDPISKKERDEFSKEKISSKRIGSGAGVQRRHRPFIQSRVRPFVSMQKFGDAPFKILAVKNFHSLDVEQQAFRRIMEQYSTNCRMILITDCVSGIIDPIISRCQVIFVPFLKPEIFNRYLKMICDKEQIPITLDVLSAVRYMAKNNIGRALDLIQLTRINYNFVTIETVSKMDSSLNFNIVKDLFTRTLEGNFKQIRATLRDIFYKYALSKSEIMLQLSRIITQMPLPREIRSIYLDLIAEADFNCLDSNDDEIQLNALLSKMALIGKEIRS